MYSILRNTKYERRVQIYYDENQKEDHVVYLFVTELGRNRVLRSNYRFASINLNRKQPLRGNILRNRKGRVYATK